MSKRVAYVTGGMGGIGTAICQRLHKDGFKVVAGCGPTRDYKQWLEEQKALGYTFYASAGNVGDWDSTVEAFAKGGAPVIEFQQAFAAVLAWDELHLVVAVILGSRDCDDGARHQTLGVQVIESKEEATPVRRRIAQLGEIGRVELGDLEGEHGALLVLDERRREQLLHLRIVGQQAERELVEADDVIDRRDRAGNDVLIGHLVDQEAVIRADLVRLAARGTDRREIRGAPEPLIVGPHELEVAMLAREAEVQRELHEVEFRGVRPDAQDILHENGIGQRLLLLLDVLLEPAEIAAAEPGNPILGHPLVAEVGDVDVVRQGDADRLGNGVVVLVRERRALRGAGARRRLWLGDRFRHGFLGWLDRFRRGDLRGGGRRDRMQRLEDELDVLGTDGRGGRRLGRVFLFLIQEVGVIGQREAGPGGIDLGPLPLRCRRDGGLGQRGQEPGRERMNVRRIDLPGGAPLAGGDDERLVAVRLERKDRRVRRDRLIDLLARRLCLACQELPDGAEGNANRRVVGHEHAARTQHIERQLRDRLRALGAREIDAQLFLVCRHALGTPCKRREVRGDDGGGHPPG